MYYQIKDYSFLNFVKSPKKFKKYRAILVSKKTGKKISIDFGDNRYQQYRDSTNLGIYTFKDHNDLKRRNNYRKRHSHFLKKGYYSPGYFSYYYLW